MSLIMESSFCFAVFFAAVVLYAQMSLALAGGLSLSDCEDYQYTINNGNQCIDCPACPAGQEYTPHCGYEEKNGNITRPDNNKKCEDCPPHYYKTSKSQYICDECKRKCPKGTKMIHPCNKTHDMKCSKCPKGFYTVADGSCIRCSFCCGGTRSAIFVEKECKDAGMGQCSCSPIRNCVDNSGACARSSILSATTATITTGNQRKQPSGKTSQHSKPNQRLPGAENNKQDCRNKAILRQLRKLLSKYKRRVIIKISVTLKDRKQRKARRKGRDLSTFKQAGLTSHD